MFFFWVIFNIFWDGFKVFNVLNFFFNICRENEKKYIDFFGYERKLWG